MVTSFLRQMRMLTTVETDTYGSFAAKYGIGDTLFNFELAVLNISSLVLFLARISGDNRAISKIIIWELGRG